jgi:hypothetical protein
VGAKHRTLFLGVYSQAVWGVAWLLLSIGISFADLLTNEIVAELTSNRVSLHPTARSGWHSPGSSVALGYGYHAQFKCQ